MKHRTDEELRSLAREAAERDFARLQASGLPITPELVQAMARRAAEALAAADGDSEMDQEQPDPGQNRAHHSWWSKWLGMR